MTHLLLISQSTRRWQLAVYLWFGLLLLTATPTAAQVVPGTYVVKLSERADVTLVESSARELTMSRLVPEGLARGRMADRHWERIRTVRSNDPELTRGELLARLGAPNVEWLEPVYELEFFDYPQDEFFPYQWYLQNTGQLYPEIDRIAGSFNDSVRFVSGTAGMDIDIAPMYDHMPAASTRVVVAIIDSGVDTFHPDLVGTLWRNVDEIGGNGLDDDHNGYIDDTLGYDVSGDSLNLFDPQGDNEPMDTHGHGTHIAGIVAAVHNEAGVAGVATQAEIMAVKVRPNATSTVGAAGIVYAVDAGAQIINVSWGTPYEALVLKEALDYARDHGVLVCVAAGNTGGPDLYYPAAYDGSFVVAATNSDGYLASFTTYGPHIDVAAPGESILSLRAAGTDMYAEADEPNVHILAADSQYYISSGTSMATPLVAGAAALLWSIRPDLTLDTLEAYLRLGCTDIVDPFNTGDSLIGADSISGFGRISVSQSLSLAVRGGLFFSSPNAQARYVDSIEVRAAAIGGYSGGWSLAYATTSMPNAWTVLASGPELPADSLLAVLSPPGVNGHLILRLTDDFGLHRYQRCVLVRDSEARLTIPTEGGEYTYFIPITGSLFGPDYDSAALFYRPSAHDRVKVVTLTGEYFDSLIYNWNASGIALGEYTLYLEAYFETETSVDSVTFSIASAFAEGWPRALSGRGGLSPVTADLDGDGPKEIIIGTSYGLNVFDAHGEIVPGFPALIGIDVRGLPAVYDIDGDGDREIICASDSGIHVVSAGGEDVAGWPVECLTGVGGFGYPSVSVAELNPYEDSAIVLVNRQGNVLAYEFNGDSYFYSLAGWFASFHSQTTGSAYFGGDAVASADLDGDDVNEVVVTYSALQGRAGVAIFEGRTGQPAFDRPFPHAIEANAINGSMLADLTGDGLPEIVAVGNDTLGVPTLWVLTVGFNSVPGFPVTMPDASTWRGSQPMVADIDRDGSREILCTFFGFDVGVLYIFESNGRPYLQAEDGPFGLAYSLPTTFGVPVVADLTGDDRLEVIIRSGYIFPGTNHEQVHVLDHAMRPLPGWPVATPAPAAQVFSTPFAPTVDDIDNDGKVELLLVSEGASVYVWDFDASYNAGANTGRLLVDERNSSVLPGVGLPVSVNEHPSGGLPATFRLSQNYPNPFNPSTTIEFALPARTHARLEVFNVLGQRVTIVVDKELPAGAHEFVFDGSSQASGVYFYRLSTESVTLTRKMMLLK